MCLIRLDSYSIRGNSSVDIRSSRIGKRAVFGLLGLESEEVGHGHVTYVRTRFPMEITV